MTFITRWVLSHRRRIALTWLILLLAGGYAAALLGRHLSQDFEIPGTPSARADAAIVAAFGSGGSQPPLVPVIRLPAGTTVRQPRIRADLRTGCAGAATAARRWHGQARIACYGPASSPALASADGRVTPWWRCRPRHSPS